MPLMIEMPLTEWIGYGASALILISMMMASVLKLRVINLLGSILFVAYGIIIQAYPVVFMNGCIAVVNVWYIVHIRNEGHKAWHVLEVCSGQAFIQAFFKKNKKALRMQLPAFTPGEVQFGACWVLIKGMRIAGIFCGKYEGDHTLMVQADFISKDFQDLNMQGFMYSRDNIQQLKDKGLTRLVAQPQSQEHKRYLEDMHFVAVEGGLVSGRECLPLMHRNI